METSSLLEKVKEYAKEYLEELPQRRVYPAQESLNKLNEFSTPLPDAPTDPSKIIEQLYRIGSPNTMTSNSGRFFGFVFGGSLPASLAANWLSAVWDQNAVFKITSPISAQIEKVAAGWLLDVLKLPAKSAVGFVTGTTMANFCAMVAARQKICSSKGWNIKTHGFNGAPPIRVIAGDEVHVSMLRALMLAGFGTENIIRVPADDQGRFIADKLPDLDDSTIICLQAGNVNTGAIDPIKDVCMKANGSGAWVHVDGAFGLWANASPARYPMIEGCDLADSWAIDLHKWLNVPYDSGLIICKEARILEEALSIGAAYLPDPTTEPDPYLHTPELSRKARGIEAWAALYSLGRTGLTDLIERCCRYAVMFADNLKNAGFKILNDVTLNQVLVSFGSAEETNRIIKKIQEDGTCWCGGTVWKGITAMRISVSSWATTEQDIQICSEVIIKIARQEI